VSLVATLPCRTQTIDLTDPDAPPRSRGEEPYAMAIAPGDRLLGTPFVVVRLVGHGGMGEVYEVEHVELGRRVALKVLHARHADRPDLAARIRDEARLLAKLRHPSLVDVFDLGVTADGRPWFAMPLLRGRDLRDELARRGPLPPHEAIAWMAQALDGLAAAHAAGLVHRDVKLENLFLEEHGAVKVLDFGVAKITQGGALGLTNPGAPPGTPRVMAPEQCAGREVDARADLYAAGLALYELVTGRGPFDDLRGNDDAMRYAHCAREPLPPSRVAKVPAGVDAIVLRALAKEPRDRFQSATEMAHALRSLLAEPGPRPPRSRRRRAPRARGPWVMAMASTLAVAFFAAGLAFGRALPLVVTGARAPTSVPATKL
jgi:eukaryotic-like serine/threonine-protein kinase